MQINSAGIVLSYYREKYSFTLEQVCRGICSVSTLSRIENGIRCADSLTCSRLLERIGKEVYQFEILLDDEDYALWLARASITDSREKKEYSRMKREICSYRRMKNSAQNLHEQFCMYQEIMMAAETLKDNTDGYDLQDKKKGLRTEILKALRLTSPAFEVSSIGKGQLYTSAEIELILLLVHFGEYQTDACTENALLDLFRHVDYFYTGHKKQRIGQMILMELIELEERLDDPEKRISYIDKAIDFIVNDRDIGELALLHYLRAHALTRLYGEAALTDSVKSLEIQKECLMAYSICDILGDKQQIREIEQFCGEELAWQITGQEM